MTRTAMSGDNTLSKEEIISQADRCLRLLMEIFHERFSDWELSFIRSQELLNTKREACSYRELLKLREIVGEYCQ